jgi:hypothetical protein
MAVINLESLRVIFINLKLLLENIGNQFLPCITTAQFTRVMHFKSVRQNTLRVRVIGDQLYIDMSTE